MARKGKIPAFKVGKDWRFRRSTLLTWSETNPGIQKKIRLLVIDDDAGVRKLMRRYFDPMGYSVTTVKNGVEGLERIENEPFDLVLLDLAMPVMNGPAFIREMRKTHANIPIIIVSGYPDSKQMMEASRFGPLTLIPKPIDKKMLLSTVKLTLKGALSDRDSVG
jgi:DNA-binding NtrC family response regulator